MGNLAHAMANGGILNGTLRALRGRRGRRPPGSQPGRSLGGRGCGERGSVDGKVRPGIVGQVKAILFKRPDFFKKIELFGGPTLFKKKITHFKKPGFFKGRPFKMMLALAAAVVIFGLLAFVVLAAGTTFTVNSTGDAPDADLSDGQCQTATSNECTLRAAIEQANDTSTPAGLDTIDFNIPGSGVQTIAPTSPLPSILDPVVIDGYSQPGATPNTLAIGDNAHLLIELSGANAGQAIFRAGLQIASRGAGSTIRGLTINRFQNPGSRSSVMATR